MAFLSVYEANGVNWEGYEDFVKTSIDLNGVCEGKKTILLRTIFDYGGSTDALLSRVLFNGHDRLGKNNWGGIMPERVRSELSNKGYQARDLIWAREVDIERPAPFYKSVSPTRNIAFLLIDPDLYNKEFSNIYGQQDADLRKEALLGLVLLDRSLNSAGERRDLNFDLNQPMLNTLPRIYDEGYFPEDLR